MLSNFKCRAWGYGCRGESWEPIGEEKLHVACAGQNLISLASLTHDSQGSREEVRTWSRAREPTDIELVIHCEDFVRRCHGNSTCRLMKACSVTPQNNRHCVAEAWLKCARVRARWENQQVNRMSIKGHFLFCDCLFVYGFSNPADNQLVTSSPVTTICIIRCWLEQLLWPSSITLLHKIRLVHYCTSPSAYWCSEMLWQRRVSFFHANKAFMD